MTNTNRRGASDYGFLIFVVIVAAVAALYIGLAQLFSPLPSEETPDMRLKAMEQYDQQRAAVERDRERREAELNRAIVKELTR